MTASFWQQLARRSIRDSVRQFERDIAWLGSVTFYLPQCAPQALLLDNIADSRWPNPVCPQSVVPGEKSQAQQSCLGSKGRIQLMENPSEAKAPFIADRWTGPATIANGFRRGGLLSSEEAHELYPCLLRAFHG